MMDLLLLALIPVAVYVGWWLARMVERYSRRKRNRFFNDQYFQGLNYLLTEQPDKAIAVFLELAEVNEDTIETHMALGNLFRSRGEVDRAIRFHQNIIAKRGLKPAQRTAALLELGEDYMRAGLLDRAEKLFSELIEADSHSPSALRSLLDIYQQEKEWGSALEKARRLEQVEGIHMGETMAQFCCELAESALAADDMDEALRQLRQARRHDADCVRARLILARIHTANGADEETMALYEEIAELDTDYIADVIEPYLETCRRVGAQPRAYEKLKQWVEGYQGISLILGVTDMMAEAEGHARAAEFLIAQLGSRPSVRGLDRLMDLNSDGRLDLESSDEILKAVTSRLLARQPRYRCHHCGFSGHTHHWQCPSCRRWNTTRTIHGVLGE